MRNDNLTSQDWLDGSKETGGSSSKVIANKFSYLKCILGCAVAVILFIQPLQNLVRNRNARQLAQTVISNFEEDCFKGSNDILLVGSNMKYNTISDAVSDAKDGDTIFILPGVYIESVKVSHKTLRIVGADKNKCVLLYPNGDYHNPPLEMGSGFLANMTIRASSQLVQAGAIAKAYCMHTDFNISSNHVFVIENVSFVNDDYQVVGIGLRDNFELRFKNCEFVCYGNNNAFYCHDDPINRASKNQNLIVEDCVFVNNGVHSTILLQSQEEPNSEITCVWKNNILCNNGSGGTLDVIHWTEKISENSGWLGMSYWNNSKESTGNELELLNAEDNIA